MSGSKFNLTPLQVVTNLGDGKQGNFVFCWFNESSPGQDSIYARILDTSVLHSLEEETLFKERAVVWKGDPFVLIAFKDFSTAQGFMSASIRQYNSNRFEYD